MKNIGKVLPIQELKGMNEHFIRRRLNLDRNKEYPRTEVVPTSAASPLNKHQEKTIPVRGVHMKKDPEDILK